MTNNGTAEQVRVERDRVLGPTVGRIYSALCHEVASVHAKWSHYRILFADSPERIDLLNQVAPVFFRMIQDMLIDDVILHLARITEPQPHKDTLTLHHLARAISDKAIVEDITNLVVHVDNDPIFRAVKDWRDRDLAHQNRALAINEHVVPLLELNRENIDKALTAVSRVLNRIECHYWIMPIDYTKLHGLVDAESLAYYLKLAVAAKSQQE